jgi:hypothetical protein
MKLVVVLAAVIAMGTGNAQARADHLVDTSSVEVAVRAADGTLVPLTEPSRLGDNDWARVEYRDSKSKRAPMQVQVETAVPEANAAGISALVTAALMSTHRVKVYDPAIRLSHSRPKYILKVQVTEYEANKKGHGLGGLGSGLLSHATRGVVGGASLGSQKAEVEFTIQLLSARTGEVLQSSEIKGKSSSVHVGLSGINVGGVAPTEVETWSNPAIASAARVAAAKAAYKVYEWVGKAERT